ncbi:TylF/MycF family methyltransferase [Amylibacter sp.]|nr:TylF/MycF family methyltransferase [Amylibacter sp.]MDC1414278.1 TylF/MycF family methyltransferase [Amylibacter sp.]
MIKRVIKSFRAKVPKTLSLKRQILRRNLYWHSLFNEARDVEGCIVECGVGTGTGLCTWSTFSMDLNEPKEIYAIDSFEGFSKFVGEDGDKVSYQKYKKNYSFYTKAYVKEHLIEFGIEQSFIENKINFLKGYVPEILDAVPSNLKISILNLDFDLYEPIKAAFLQLYPQVVTNGVILFDEYDKPEDLEKWPGSKKAIDEVFDILKLDKKDIIKDPSSGYSYYIKSG